MKKLLVMKGTLSIILIWIVLYLVSKVTNITSLLGGKGINLIEGDYYRILTGALLHNRFWPLIFNCLALFFIGYFLERHVGSTKYLLFAFVTCIVSEFIFSNIYKHAELSIGGSSITFSLIGLIIISQLLIPSFPRFRLGTWYGNWILIYALATNFPLFSFVSISTLIIHGVSLLIGIIFGAISIKIRLLQVTT